MKIGNKLLLFMFLCLMVSCKHGITGSNNIPLEEFSLRNKSLDSIARNVFAQLNGDQGTVLWSFFELIILLFKKMLLYLHCQSTKHQYMPRQERTKSGTGIYHVMLRGINKQDMFEDDEDYLQMTSIKTKMITEPSLGHFRKKFILV